MPLSLKTQAFFILFISCLSANAQLTHISDTRNNLLLSKNSIDCGVLGNKGFFFVGYNRTLLETKHLFFQISPAIGLVPGNQEDSATAIPDFLHLNLGANMLYGRHLNRLSLGFSYSWILVNDIYKTRPKSRYGRLLGEFAYIRHFRHDQMAIKVAFTPILYDNGANDVQNIPVAVIFRTQL